MILDEMKEVLKLLAVKLEGIRWIVLGSTNVALHGIDIVPNDIDILTDRERIEKISKVLKEFEVKPFKYGEREFFRPYIAEYKING